MSPVAARVAKSDLGGKRAGMRTSGQSEGTKNSRKHLRKLK